MSAGTRQEIGIEPIIHYPQQAEPGKAYLLTVDLRPVWADLAAWPYEQEEYVVNCRVHGGDLFVVEPLGDATVVVHRFGGTYGPARFVLTARAEAGQGTIRVGLVNGWGVPLDEITLESRAVAQQVSPLAIIGNQQLTTYTRSEIPQTVTEWQAETATALHYLAREVGEKITPDRNDKGVERYLRRLRQVCNVLPLAALGNDETGSEVTLDEIYIAMDTQHRVQMPEEEDREQKRRQSSDSSRNQDGRVLTALEAVTITPRVVMLGGPGSGKSTFVHQLIARLASVCLGEASPLPGWPDDIFPIFTLLHDLASPLAELNIGEMATREHEQSLLAVLRQRWQQDLQRMAGTDISSVLEDALNKGQVLIVLDGLDEVPVSLRGLVQRAIHALTKVYPTVAHIVVTSRIRSYIGEAVLRGFTIYTLANFDDEKIQAFVQAWYGAQARLGRLRTGVAEVAGRNLKQALLRPALRELAANPMLVTTMAIIHQREARLPKERARLYSLAVDVLLTRWQLGKEIALSARLTALLNDYLKLRQLMERLAYEAMQRSYEVGMPELTRGELLVMLEEPDWLGDTGLASEFLDYVDERAGLLIGIGGDQVRGSPQFYRFPHRTFQEYLAGCYLISGRSRERTYLRHAAEGDFWHPAAQMGAEELLYNRANPEGVLDLMYALCPNILPETMNDWRALLWSGYMATLIGNTTILRDQERVDGGTRYLERLVPRLLTAIRSRLLNPIDRAEAGRTLADLGDPRPAVMTTAGMEFCYVPGDQQWAKQPAREQAPAYWLGRYPVTNAQFQMFVAAGGYTHKQYWPEAAKKKYWRKAGFQGRLDDKVRTALYELAEPFRLANHPVVGVTWYEAMAFCRWLSGQMTATGWEVRLPTQKEWERAARGSAHILANPLYEAFEAQAWISTSELAMTYNEQPTRHYPWGDIFSADLANSEEAKIGTTSAVGCFAGGASVYGVEELSGNVWEWLLDGPGDIVGGSYRNYADRLTCAAHLQLDPSFRDDNIGFRCVVAPISH